MLLLACQAIPAARDDGRLFGHFTYPEAPSTELAPAPPGFAVGQPCRLRAVVLPDLDRLLAAARAAGLGASLRGLSCFRSVARQGAVFHRGGRRDDAARAESVGPPGHSEHATGYALDFAVRPAGGCRDVDACFADTPAGRWLLANGPAYGFELSFPAGNRQGVAYESWHWRWVGASQEEPGAADARAAFTAARTRFPAAPEEAGFALTPASPPLP